MSAIWKFPLVKMGSTDVVEVEMPFYSSPLSVINQDECITLYALVEPPTQNEPTVTRRFRIVPTGVKIHDEWPEDKFIGTVALLNARFIFHIFEVDTPSG